MDVLREWLAPTMIREIGAMMQSRTGASDWSNPIDGNPYSDDGSNLRARSSRSGVVQITKLYATDGPIKVVISDSYTMVRATIASSAATRYGSTTKRRITKDTLGGLIQILDFEIVATHLGSRPERATIFINDFKSIGSEGSGAFGCPRPLESLSEVVELLDQLKELRARESQGSQPRSRLGSVTEGSPINSPLAADSPEATQVMFATQVPSRYSERSLRADSGVQQEGVTKSIGSKPEDAINDNHDTAARHTEDRPSVKAKAKTSGKRNVNNPDALLSLLAPKRTATHPDSKSVTETQRDVAQSPKSGEKSPDPGPNIRNLSITKANNQTITWPTATNTPMNIHADGQELENALSRTPAAQPSNELDISSRHTPRDSPLAHVGYSSQEIHNSSHSGGAVGCNTISETGKPFKRICSSDTRIPNDQQKLLDRADSWLPAEPGQRGPVANVPIATLQTFNHRAELAARQSLPSPAHQHQEEEGADDVTTSLASQPSPRLRDAGNDDSDPEIPLSSSEWPLSPPLEQPTDEPPPDSSMESIGHLSTVSGKDSNHSTYNSQIPPPFETSPSSTATRSSQRKAKRTSKALQIAARSSPSLVSGSADEDGKRFRCREFGCHKAYVGPSGLRYHMQHGHNSSQHKGSPSRPRVPKSKTRGKYPPTIYICTRCYNHFDSEAEIAHHENLNSCSPPQVTLTKEPVVAKVDVGQSLTNTENSSTTPLQNDKVVDLREGKQKDGPSSVVWRLGESTPIPPRPTYVSSYVSPRQAERLITSSISSPKSISGRHVETTPNLSRSTPPPEARVSQLDGKWSKGARSDVSSVESELETTIPHALNEATDLHVNSPPMQQFPSTAPHSEGPFTQVKRTPYVNGRFNGNVHSHPGLHVFPVNGKMNDLPFIASTKQIDRGLIPHASTPPITTVQQPQDNVGEGHPMHNVEDQVIVDQTVTAPQFRPEVAAQSSTSRSVSPTRKRNLIHLESMALRSTSVSTSSESTLHRDDLSVTETRSDSGLKRNAFEPMPLSPHVAKRRKRTKAPAAFKFSQDAPVAQDPSILARAYRQEFLASRKSSASEQSDASMGATGLTENSSDPIIQQNHQIDVVQDGNPGSKFEGDKPPPATNLSQPANTSVVKIPLATSKANNQLTASGTNEDVVMTTENQDNLIDPVNSSSALQERDPSSIINGLLVNQHHDTNKDIKHPESQKYLELVLAYDSVSTNAKDLDPSKTNRFASSQLGADNQEGRAEFESVSTVRTFGDDNETDSNVAPFAQENGQSFLNPVNACLSSGQESDLITSGGPFEKFPTQAPQIARKPPSPKQASIQAPEVAENSKAPAQADVLMTDTNPRSSIRIVEAPSSQDKPTNQIPHTTPVTVFETFKVSYPEYKGNEQRFVAICKKINALVQQDRMEHRSLWDDFIIRHTMEYTQYLQTCALNAEDPLPYERFYRNEIEDPRFTKRIVTPKNLKEILGIGAQEDSMVSSQQQQHHHHPTQQPLTQQSPNQQRLFQRSLPYQPLNADLQDGSPIPAFKSSPKSTSVNASISKPPVLQPTVDLTNASDDEEPKQSMKRTRRSLPWEKSSQDVAPSPSPLRVPNLGNATSGHSLATSIKSMTKVPTSLNMSIPTGSSAKTDVSCSSPISPLPRTSSKIKPEFIRRTSQVGQRASKTPSKSASVSKPPSSDTGHASRDTRTSFSKGASFSKSITVNNEQQPIFAENPHHTQNETKKVSWKDPDNPFKQFAKAYTAIKPAKGNAFAMEQAKAVAAAKEKAKAKAKARDEVKQIVKEMEKAKEEKRGEEKTPTGSRGSSRGPRTRKPKHSNLNIVDWHL